jgi:hypothetical protein
MDNLSTALGQRYTDPVDLFRSVDKYTNCGAQAGLLIEEIAHAPTSSDPWAEAGGTYWVYNAQDLPSEAWDGLTVLAVSVSSCVEGIDATTQTYIVRAEDVGEETFSATWDASIAAVEEEAYQLWHETHGCETCAAHHGVNLDDEHSPVWDECPDCDGYGETI